jgi:hypothetical protein
VTPHRSLRALLVDVASTHARLLERTLGEAGWRMQAEAADGSEALAAALRRFLAGGDPEREAATNVLLARSESVTEGVQRRLGTRESIHDLLDQVEVEAEDNANVLRITATDTSPRRAAAIAPYGSESQRTSVSPPPGCGVLSASTPAGLTTTRSARGPPCCTMSRRAVSTTGAGRSVARRRSGGAGAGGPACLLHARSTSTAAVVPRMAPELAPRSLRVNRARVDRAGPRLLEAPSLRGPT